MSAKSDVLIVGAGPVGMLTALTLLQSGASVRLIEKEPGIVNSPRAAVYFPSSMIALEKLGILDELMDIGFTNNKFGPHIPEFGHHSVITFPEVEGIPWSYQLHVGQDEVARIAMEHALKLGLELQFEEEVQSLTDHGNHVSVTTKARDDEQIYEADWLIGCDGARSTVRKLSGIEFAGHTWPERFIATNVQFPFEEIGYQQANFVCDPVNMAVIAQLDEEGLWRCTYMEDSSLPVETYEERIHQRYEYFMQGRKDYRIDSSSPYMLHQRAAETLHKGRVLLAGDAAHATNPCGGLGLTSGMWTGLILADILGAILKGEEDVEILSRFSKERRRIFWDIVTPAATENKRMLQESDPVQRQKDLAAVQALGDDPDTGVLMLLFSYKVIGDTLRANSRWADADPTDKVAIDIAGREAQLH